jgi:hypothetical protein
MAVENHPLYPKWRAALERLIEAKARFDDAFEHDTPAWRAAQQDWNDALIAYAKIAEDL